MFMLFTGHNYYPGGGWTDFRGFFLDVVAANVEAKRLHRDEGHNWYQIVGSVTDGTGIVEEGNLGW